MIISWFMNLNNMSLFPKQAENVESTKAATRGVL